MIFAKTYILKTMPEKQNLFQNLRPMLLGITIGILQLFLWIEVLIMSVLGYFWYKNPEEALKNNTPKGFAVLGVLLVLTFIMKKKIEHLLKTTPHNNTQK
jgi:hypothetical protein